MKYIVCYSGGHSSALAAVETVWRYGKENVILLNHDINPNVEHEDIKRFKNEVACYLGIDITYANMNDWNKLDPIAIAVKIKAFKVGNGTALCTNRIKTEPFFSWLELNYPSKPLDPRKDLKIIYGFEKNERHRIQRRIGVLINRGYLTDYPLAFWPRTISQIEEIGINRPSTYKTYRHANCIGCLNAGKQQWYIVYCLRQDLWVRAKKAEELIGYSIIKDYFLEDLEPKFEKMKRFGIIPTEKINHQKFWSIVRSELTENVMMPCECSE